MANPRQRRKQRSGTKPLKPSKRTLKNKKKLTLKNIPKEIADKWDKSRTVQQNMRDLGLLTKLDPRQAGGVESAASTNKAAAPAAEDIEADGDHIPAGYARLVRDADGNVIDIIESTAEPVASTSKATPWGAPLEAWGSEDEGEESEMEADEPAAQGIALGSGRIRKSAPVEAKTEAAKLLEARAAELEAIPHKERHASDRETEWLRALYKTHGEDVDKMSRDKRNKLQRTPGQLRQSIKRAGGFAALA